MSSPSPSPSPYLSSRGEARTEIITDTGWRVVGRAVALVTDPPGGSQLPAGRDEDVLYAARFRVRRRLGSGSAVQEILTVLGSAVSGEWEGAPPLTRHAPVNRPPGRFHGVRWDTLGEVGAWTGELVWRHPHPVIAGAPCTTHILIVEQGLHTELTVRISADAGLTSVRGMAGVGQARPEFLTEMNRSLSMSFDGSSSEAATLHECDIDGFVCNVLLSERRTTPVAVLAPLEDGSYVVSPDTLADELLGLAQLHVLPSHPATYRLSDSLGDRRISCYWGALRIYMPEFSRADSTDEHPLLVQDRLSDPVMRAALYGRLGREVALHVVMPPGVAARRAPPAVSGTAPVAVPSATSGEQPASDRDTPPAAGELEENNGVPAALTGILAPMPPLLESLAAHMSTLSGTIERLVEANAVLADEIERLRTTNSVRAASTTSLEKRIAGLERLLERNLATSDWESEGGSVNATGVVDEASDPEDAGDDSGGYSLPEVLRLAGSTHTDALLILDSAERAAADSPYEDAERVAVILDAMAGVARRRQAGALGSSLRQAFRDIGIDYRGGISQTTSERHQQQYMIAGPGSRMYDCREHIALGVSYDPRHCLRIYFTSRAPVEPRFVIGYVGRHFEVKTST